MLANEDIQYLHQTRTAIVMGDTDILEATIKSTLREIAKQASALGIGLQNAAPGDKGDAPNNSVQYLLTIADELAKMAEESDSSQSESSQDK
jgi:hypothetical protein